MRYLNSDIIVFTDKNNISYQIKDNLPTGIYQRTNKIKYSK